LVEDSLLFRVLAVEQLENLGFVIESRNGRGGDDKVATGQAAYAAAIVEHWTARHQRRLAGRRYARLSTFPS
jgi:hypothetical protein